MDAQTSEQIGLVVNSYCDFFAPISYPSMVELGLGVVEIGRSSVKYEVGVFEQGEDMVKAVGGLTHVFVDRKSRKSNGKGMEMKIRTGLLALQGRAAAKL